MMLHLLKAASQDPFTNLVIKEIVKPGFRVFGDPLFPETKSKV